MVGSRAYGLDHGESDTDVRGIYLPPADFHWSLYGVPEQLENPEKEDCFWELQKFLVLALKANPNVLGRENRFLCSAKDRSMPESKRVISCGARVRCDVPGTGGL